MVGRNRQCRRTRHRQKPGQILGFASEFLANGSDLRRLAFRFKGGDQPAQPRSQRGGVERFVPRQPGEIAEQRTKTPQSGRPGFLGAFPGGPPQRAAIR